MEVSKITIGKSDEPTEIAERIIDAQAHEIILVVPRFSKVAESAANFRLLKRDADALKKKLRVESVDEQVIELCKSCEIECVNPFFSEPAKKFSDIVRSRGERDIEEKKAIQATVHHSAGGHEAGHSTEALHRNKSVKSGRFEEPNHHRDEISGQTKEKFRGKHVSRAALAIFAFIVLVAGSAFVVFAVLPRAEITIITAKTNWSYNDAIAVDTDTSEPDAKTAKIPGQIFSENRNLELSFPATGKKNIERRASGSIRIWNAYGSLSQKLVASTRFVAPDGKVFRLAEAVTVPGAKVVAGKIEPAYIAARVSADKPGIDYNIGPVAKFTIPGFAGTPKFEGFYADSSGPMTGGFSGESFYPTEDDIAGAKAEMRENLEGVMKAFVFAKLPSELKILDGSPQFKLKSERVNTDTGEEGKFSVYAEGEFSLVAFREPDLLGMLEERMRNEASPDFEVKSHEIEYGEPRFSVGGMSFSVNYNAVLAKKVDVSELKKKLAGKSETDLKTAIFSVPGFASARAALWPFWVKAVPDKEEKISIIIE